MENKEILKGALMSGVINAVINGIVNWFMVRGEAEILLTQDLISSNTQTVFSGIVPLATSLAFILTTIAFFTFKIPGKPNYFPKVFFLALRNTFMAFGLVIAIAIMIQKYASDIVATPVASAILAGIIAGLVAGLVDYITKHDILNIAQHSNK